MSHVLQQFTWSPALYALTIALAPGTYCRTAALDRLIEAFLSEPSYTSSSTPTNSPRQRTKQIISVGAGTDTRYYRLRAQNKHHNLIYHEMDFGAVSASKHRIVSNSMSSGPLSIPGSQNIFRQCEITRSTEITDDNRCEWGFDSAEDPTYVFHPLDLRSIPSLPNLKSIQYLRSDLPTIIISECCLCYLEVDKARDVIKWFADRIPDLGIILYEPIGAHDPFGQMMVRNLAARGINMPTVHRYKTVEDQIARLRDLGFNAVEEEIGARAESIEAVWENWITDKERERVDGLEGLDEVEEWTLLARHYAVVWAWEGDVGEGWNALSRKGSGKSC